MIGNNSFIINLPEKLQANVRVDEKSLSSTFLGYIDHIYHMKEQNEDLNSEINWFNPDPEAEMYFTTVYLEEKKSRDFLHQFAERFDELKDLKCFSVLRSFKPGNDNNRNYVNKKEETLMFDVNIYIKTLTNENGKIKSKEELEKIPEETIWNIASAAKEYCDKIIESCSKNKDMGFSKK